MCNSSVCVLYFDYPFGYLLCFDMVCETNIIITRKVLFSSTLGNATALPRPPFQMGDIDIIHYTTNFYGWTRPVKAKMARDTCDTLHLSEEYPSIESFSNAEGNIYKTICEFEMSLRRMKDE